MESSKRRQSIIRHPLRDLTTLEHVFHYLPVEDLKACRMTLKLWHEPATRILAEKIQGILLHEKTEWKKFLKVFTKSCTSTRISGLSHIHPFHSFIFYNCYPEDPSWTPYKSAILDYMHAKVKLPKKTLWEEKFFTTFGLQVLELRYCQFNFLNTERSLREFREMLSTNCPNLSALTLEFQKEQPSTASTLNRTNSTTGTPTPSTSPTPSPSPQIQMNNSACSNVFFPPNEESLRKSMDNLKRFVFCTDNKCWVNPNALEEFMSFMPSLEEFTYRYTGAKKQWAFVRRVDVIDIICNLIQCGSFSNLKVLDLDSKGTVLSGEDFRKLSAGLAGTKEGDELSHQSSATSSSSPPIVNIQHDSLSSAGNSTIQLTRFASQVFIKSEQDWDYFCSWLSKFNLSLKEIDIQVRSHFSQLPAEEQLPTIFPKVTTATLLLDNNFQVFLRRMPNVQKFCGVYDNELLPFCSATQNLSLDSGMILQAANNNGSSSPSSTDGNNGGFIVNNSYYQHRRRSSKRGGGGGVCRTWSVRSRSRSRSVENSPAGTPGSHSGASAQFFPPTETSSPAKKQQEAVTQARYLRIYSNEESMLDIEWKAGLFQHVTFLETDVYFDQDLRLIWTHLHQIIDELVLHLKTLIPEQAFTGAGVPAITFQDLCRSQSKSGKGKETSSSIGEKDYHDEEHLTALDEFPHLGMMKKLRRFEVHTEGRQDAFGTQFSASIIIFGVSLLPKLERLVLPPAIPPKCLENSISYLGKLTQLRYLAVCDDTFQSVLPFHVLKCGLPDLEIAVKYYQSDIKRTLCNPWRAERLIFPDFLPEHRSSSLGGNGGNPLPVSGTPSSSVRSRFHLSKQCSAP